MTQRTKHQAVLSRGKHGSFEADLGVDDGVEVDVLLENVPDIPPALNLAFLLQVAVVLDTALDPAC